MPFKTVSEPIPVESLQSAFEAVYDYVVSLGVNRNNARLSAYRDFLHSYGKVSNEIKNPENVARLCREIHELTWVLTVFKDNNLNPPIELLKKSLNGQPLEEYSSDAGRNFF
jgi:hypothetical protein